MKTHPQPWSGEYGQLGDRMHHRRPARAYLPGRVCIMADCGSVLSRYNPADTCFLHTEARPVLVYVRNQRGVG